MAISTVLMTGGADLDNLAGSYGYRCLSQRADGVIIYIYLTSSSITTSYSYDLGLTWTQRVLGTFGVSELHSNLLSNGYIHHIGYNPLHSAQLPCGSLVTKTNLNSPFLWDAEFDYSASQVVCTMVDDEDKIHVIFKDNAFKALLYYTIYDPDTDTFSFPETFTNGASGGIFGGAPDNACQMAMDSTGKIHVLYIDNHSSSPGLFYQYRSVGGIWSSPIGGVASTAVTRSLQSGGSNFDVQYASMVIDNDDNVHIVYSLHFDGTGDVGGYRSVVDYGKWNGSTFDRTVIYEVADRRAEYSIISTDAAGNIYIVYGKNKASAGTAYDIFMRKSSDAGVTWESEQTVIAGTTERYIPIYLFKTERNVPGHNILNAGCAGVYGINYEVANSDLYYFYTDDVDYKFSVDNDPDFCNLPSDVLASVGCASLAASTFDGLEHLEGETVAILADGDVQEQQVVIGGSINLASDFGIVHVGLPYNCDAETLNVEVA
jgi:hypothetical protein